MAEENPDMFCAEQDAEMIGREEEGDCMKRKEGNVVREVMIMTVATLIIAVSVYFFMIPSCTSINSISGLAVVLRNFVPFPVSAITMVINVILLILGFIICGREFGGKTVYTSILLPVILAVFEHVFPNQESITGSDILDVACYIFIVSIGSALLFNRNASSGGLDIAAKIINKYTHMELGKAMALCGMVIALSSALVYNKRIVVLSILGTYLNGLILDHFIFGQNIKRRVCIVSRNHMEEIRDFILYDLHSGASLYEATGAFSGEKYTEIIVIVDKHEYQKLMNYMIRTDPNAFVTVYNVSSMRYMKKPWWKEGKQQTGASDIV